MSTSSVKVTIKFVGKEIFDPTEAPSAQNESQRTLYTGSKGITDKEFHATSTPKVDGGVGNRELTLAGATTLDFTALQSLAIPGNVTRNLDFTGKRLKHFLFRTGAANHANGVNIAPGAANPYPLFGAGNDFTLGKGRVLASAFDGVESDLPIVAAGVKTIDLTPGAAGDILYFEFHFGTTP